MEDQNRSRGTAEDTAAGWCAGCTQLVAALRQFCDTPPAPVDRERPRPYDSHREDSATPMTEETGSKLSTGVERLIDEMKRFAEHAARIEEQQATRPIFPACIACSQIGDDGIHPKATAAIIKHMIECYDCKVILQRELLVNFSSLFPGMAIREYTGHPSAAMAAALLSPDVAPASPQKRTAQRATSRRKRHA